MKTKTIALITIGTTFVLLFFLWLFTRAALSPTWNFVSTGQIGDTIGGITSPIIGVAGSILIYISFVSQNEANKLQSQQNSFAVLLSLFKELKEDYSDMTFYTSLYNNGKSYQGRRAISAFVKVIPKKTTSQSFLNNSFISEYLYLIGSMTIYLNNVEGSDIDMPSKVHLIRLLQLFYTAKLMEKTTEIALILAQAPIYSGIYELVNGFKTEMDDSFVKWSDELSPQS